MTETMDIVEMVRAAAGGSQQAWDRLVERFMPLVISVTRGFHLSSKDVEDISQNVWLRLIEHIAALREPRALPGWIATTTRREAIRVLRSRMKANPVDPGAGGPLDRDAESISVDDRLLHAERHRALINGLAELPETQRRLLELMVVDPPLTYQEISIRLHVPIGSIGPTRNRALTRLRSSGPIQSLLGAEFSGVRRSDGP